MLPRASTDAPAKVDQPNFPAAESYRLGRRKAADPRDLDYLAAAHLEGIGVPTARSRSRATAGGELPAWAADLGGEKPVRYFNRGAQLDQGGTSQCVAYAFAQSVQSGSVKQSLGQMLERGQLSTAVRFERPGTPQHVATFLAEQYAYAQSVDEWPGAEPEYYGTSERAGAQAFRRWGFWPNFYWLWSVAEIARFMILVDHPVPIGSDWFTGMDTPDVDGFIHPTGAWRGGHCWLLDGVNVQRGVFRMRNSWGARWGEKGGAWITFAELEYLLRLGAGAVAVPEVRLPPPVPLSVPRSA